jgi:putative oxidoreductase
MNVPTSIGGVVVNALAGILAVLLAVLFAYVGCAKLIGVPGMVQEFAEIGIGQWCRYFVGILEVSGAIGVLIPKFRFWASLQLATVMAGATVTNLAVLHLPVVARLTIILMGLALALSWLRRPYSVRSEMARV